MHQHRTWPRAWRSKRSLDSVPEPKDTPRTLYPNGRFSSLRGLVTRGMPSAPFTKASNAVLGEDSNASISSRQPLLGRVDTDFDASASSQQPLFGLADTQSSESIQPGISAVKAATSTTSPESVQPSISAVKAAAGPEKQHARRQHSIFGSLRARFTRRNPVAVDPIEELGNKLKTWDANVLLDSYRFSYEDMANADQLSPETKELLGKIATRDKE